MHNLAVHWQNRVGLSWLHKFCQKVVINWQIRQKEIVCMIIITFYWTLVKITHIHTIHMIQSNITKQLMKQLGHSTWNIFLTIPLQRCRQHLVGPTKRQSEPGTACRSFFGIVVRLPWTGTASGGGSGWPHHATVRSTNTYWWRIGLVVFNLSDCASLRRHCWSGLVGRRRSTQQLGTLGCSSIVGRCNWWGLVARAGRASRWLWLRRTVSWCILVAGRPRTSAFGRKYMSTASGCTMSAAPALEFSSRWPVWDGRRSHGGLQMGTFVERPARHRLQNQPWSSWQQEGGATVPVGHGK